MKNIKNTLLLILLLASALLVCTLVLSSCGKSSQSTVTLTPAPTSALPDAGIPYATNGDLWYSWDQGSWYTMEDGQWYATDGSARYYYENAYGDTFFETDYIGSDGFEPYYGEFATDGNATPAETVTVSTVDELLAAIAPDTAVILEPGVYNLSEATHSIYDYCYFVPFGRDEGAELVCENLYNFSLSSSTGDAADVTILTEPRLANVLTFRRCWNINLTGVTMGHTAGAICAGGVLRVEECSSVYVGSCDLFGCGTWGVTVSGGNRVTVEDTVIHDCTYGALSLSNTSTCSINRCVIRDMESTPEMRHIAIFSIEDSYLVSITACTSSHADASVFLGAHGGADIDLVSCTFEDGAFTSLYSCSGVSPRLRDCTFTHMEYDTLYAEGVGVRATHVLVDGEELLP